MNDYVENYQGYHKHNSATKPNSGLQHFVQRSQTIASKKVVVASTVAHSNCDICIRGPRGQNGLVRILSRKPVKSNHLVSYVTGRVTSLNERMKTVHCTARIWHIPERFWDLMLSRAMFVDFSRSCSSARALTRMRPRFRASSGNHVFGERGSAQSHITTSGLPSVR
jgi:hypothetical protein